MCRIWKRAGGHGPTIVQDEDRERTVAGYLLGDAAQDPAFETCIAMTTHDNEVNVSHLSNIEDGLCDSTRAYFHRCLDPRMLIRHLDTCKVVDRPGQV